MEGGKSSQPLQFSFTFYDLDGHHHGKITKDVSVRQKNRFGLYVSYASSSQDFEDFGKILRFQGKFCYYFVFNELAHRNNLMMANASVQLNTERQQICK